ncbi:anthranilate synthase component II [Mangrovivirga cuniculi]|uniref:Aminodeoxychorismate/anthranilate synthase component II n=1 Tax=Mangrovivirga cuniculi TaxID=2715131 RepID=A0A4D7JTL5_9BACT|nr:aminodeoxychorismate/anthranilate synthase component II [Mangrovivirga cuniculi]QCK16012.1 aminodeoxychorismate/anthranilate synthase component II [Mangrovivirga cuniculi]
MKILVLDNYDSFTYNLVHILRDLGYENNTDVFRNDKISLEDVRNYDKILISPGPGLPYEAGILPDLLKEYGASKSIFGVCLGCQGIAEAYGGKLYNLDTVIHGVAMDTYLKDKSEPIFKDLPDRFVTTRYHSWAVNPDSLENSPIKITATDISGVIMALSHETQDVRGVQFHPESVMTPEGSKMIQNWLKI